MTESIVCQDPRRCQRTDHGVPTDAEAATDRVLAALNEGETL